MVPRCLYPWSLAFLALLGLQVPGACAASIQFTGNVQNDFNPATNFPRKTRLSALTGKKKRGGDGIHRAWSGDNPPPGTTQWICG